jgi:hypothetical protein
MTSQNVCNRAELDCSTNNGITRMAYERRLASSSLSACSAILSNVNTWDFHPSFTASPTALDLLLHMTSESLSSIKVHGSCKTSIKTIALKEDSSRKSSRLLCFLVKKSLLAFDSIVPSSTTSVYRSEEGTTSDKDVLEISGISEAGCVQLRKKEMGLQPKTIRSQTLQFLISLNLSVWVRKRKWVCNPKLQEARPTNFF